VCSHPCRIAGGRSRGAPDSFTRRKYEIWTYECSACGKQIECIVSKSP
jgi:hypothetical protein